MNNKFKLTLKIEELPARAKNLTTEELKNIFGGGTRRRMEGESCGGLCDECDPGTSCEFVSTKGYICKKS